MRRAIAFLLTVFSLSAISSFAAGRGGVGVGNGRSIFKSETGFSVMYADSLTLKVHSQGAFGISNERLVKRSEKISKIEFNASNGRVKSLQGAEALFRERHPGKAFSYLRLKGAEGLAYEERYSDRLFGIYYILTSDLEFVEISLEAYAYGNGLKLIAPIVHTFTYDRTPPRIHEVQFSPGPWEAGSRHRVRVKVTDDNSGMDMRHAFLFLLPLGADGKFLRKSSISISEQNGKWKTEGDDWYSVEITVGEYLVAGDYKMSWLGLTDAAGNFTSLLLENGDETEYAQRNGPKLPVEIIKVLNPGFADVSAPTLLSIRKEAGPWKAGEARKIHLELSDEGSGIDVKNLSCTGLNWTRSQSEKFHTEACRNPQHEEGNWYSLEIPVSRFQKDGEYFLEGIKVRDLAGNTNVYSDHFSVKPGFYQSSAYGVTDIQLHKVQLVNDGEVDELGPELLEIRTAPVWKTGTKNKIYYRARDNLSGVHPGSYGWLLPVKPDGSIIYLYSAEGTPEGNDWYSVEIEVSPWEKGGNYFLGLFSISDHALHNANLHCEEKSSPRPCKNSNGPVLPQIFVRIER